MDGKLRVSKWGSSLAVRIPRRIAEEWGVHEGSLVEIISRGDDVLLRKRRYDLDEMLAQVNDSNLHSEQDTGPAQGREEW